MLMMQRDQRLGGDLSDSEESTTRGNNMNAFNCVNNLSLQGQSQDQNDLARSLQQQQVSLDHATSLLAARNQQSFLGMGMAGPPLDPNSPRGGQQAFRNPDLYRRYTEQAATAHGGGRGALPHGTSPMQYAPEKLVSSGMRKLDTSMRFLLKLSGQSVEKNRPNDAELDMNLPFPVKLHYILSNPKYKDCVAWLPHGRAWRILKPKTFEKKVIPKFFRSAKYASFMRQVNGWAFTRITEGPDLNAYYHEMFLRGLPNLSFKMKRPPKVKSAAAAARNAAGAGSGTPDFYRISQIAPLPPSAPFRPVAQEAKGDDDGPRYQIEPFSVEENQFPAVAGYNDSLQEMPILGWDVGADTDGMDFSDPFDEGRLETREARRQSIPTGSLDSSNSSGGGQSPQKRESQGNLKMAPPGDGSIPDLTKSDDHGDLKPKAGDIESHIQQLSKADISYLAHQNRILLVHVEKQQNVDDTKTTSPCKKIKG